MSNRPIWEVLFVAVAVASVGAAFVWPNPAWVIPAAGSAIGMYILTERT